MKGKLLFKEEQTFVGTWAWYLVLGVVLFTIGGVALSVVKDPSSESLVGLLIGVSVSLLVVLLLFIVKLKVRIDQEFIYYSFYPFISSESKLSKEDIKEIRVRKYQPIMEYGGWGYRVSFTNGKALNVSGNIGLQIELANGKKILLGTQRGKEMEKAVNQLKENWELHA